MIYPRLIAHRCGGAFAPENTLAGLRAAAKLGYKMVEFDVMLAGCGMPVLMHDETLERTTDGIGRVCDTPYRELSRLSAAKGFEASHSGETIPILPHALKLAQRLGLRMNVEIKPAAGHDEATGRVVAEVLRDEFKGDMGSLVVSSFSSASLQAAREESPDLPLAMLFERLPEDWRAQCGEVGALAVHCDATKLADEHIKACHEAGLPLACYTVNEQQQALNLFGSGVSAVFTDTLLPPN